MFGNIGPTEMIFLMIILLLIFGAKRLPELTAASRAKPYHGVSREHAERREARATRAPRRRCSRSDDYAVATGSAAAAPEPGATA